MKMKRLVWHNGYLLILYIVVMAWFLISIPLVNISSGELKPRGLFVDENAISLHYRLVNNIPHYKPIQKLSALSSNNNCKIDDYVCSETSDYIPKCEVLRDAFNLSLNTALYDCQEISTQSGYLQQYIIDPYFSPKPLESILLVFPLSYSDSGKNTAVYNLLDSKWLAKRIIILLLPGDTLQGQQILLKEWLNKSHSIPPTLLGLMRHAYVLDLSSSSPSIPFQKLLLSYIGQYGNLPNMDMLSFALLKYPQLVSTQSNIDTSQLIHSSPLAQEQLIALCTQFLSYSKNKAYQTYVKRLFGLVYSMMQHTTQGTQNLHSTLLSRNIDAISFQPLTNLMNKNENKYAMKDLYEIVMQMLHMSSNLEEELHHSIFFYLLLDDTAFVGITEYGIPLGIALLSIVIMFGILYDRTTQVQTISMPTAMAGMVAIVVGFASIASQSVSHAFFLYTLGFPLLLGIGFLLKI